jgi:CRISPR-associated protein Csm4
MRLIKIKIIPKSSFASLPTGDMIFGHFAKFLYFNKDIRLDNYLQKPQIIFSDFLPDNYLYKPTLPLSEFGVDDDEKKDFRKKEFISFENLQNGNLLNCEEVDFFEERNVIKNSINRKTFSTDDSGVFAPYSIKELFFVNNIVLYALFDETIFKLEEVENILSLIGKSGFGKKSSIGKGQFEIEIDKNFKGFKKIDSNYYITLSPTIFNKNDEIENCFYDVWSKFGKFHSSQTPFKKPVVFAKSSAVVKLKNKKEYIGKALNNGYEKKSFVQGYSIVIPFEYKE